MDINKSFFTGRIGSDIELKTTQAGTPVCTFSIAVERMKAKDAEKAEVDWIDLVAWKQTAEYCSKYLSKGRKISVECICKTRTWEDRDGHKRKAVEFEIRNIVPADSKPQGDTRSHEHPQAQQPQYSSQSAPDFTEVGSDEDLPF